MSILNLDESSKALLTRTDQVPNPVDPTKTVDVSYACDLNGKKLSPMESPLPIYRDIFTGNYFVQVTERIPSGADDASTQQRDALRELKPIHYASPTGSVNGWFIPAPDFNGRDGEKPAAGSAAPAAAAPAAPAPIFQGN